jgi:hypothetical protein
MKCFIRNLCLINNSYFRYELEINNKDNLNKIIDIAFPNVEKSFYEDEKEYSVVLKNGETANSDMKIANKLFMLNAIVKCYYQSNYKELLKTTERQEETGKFLEWLILGLAKEFKRKVEITKDEILKILLINEKSILNFNMERV